MRNKRRSICLYLMVLVLFLVVQHQADSKSSSIMGRDVQKDTTKGKDPTKSDYPRSQVLSTVGVLPSDEKIPHVFHFVDTRYNILETKQPTVIYENILHSIQQYQSLWNAMVHFWVEEDCVRMMQQVIPELVDFYKSETVGANKSDMCRLVALYIHGGYYMDSDMYVNKAWECKSCAFASAMTAGTTHFMNTFLAAVPRHFFVEESLRLMLDSYQARKLGKYPFIESKDFGIIGPRAMGYALLHSEHKSSIDAECLLEEQDLSVLHAKGMYLHEPLVNGTGYCNFVLHNQKEVLFRSRIRGASRCK